MGCKSIRIFLLVAATIVAFNPLFAQTFNLQTISNNKKQFGLDYNKPFYKSMYDMSTFSGVYQVYLDIPVSSKFNIVGNIPYINTSYTFNFGFGKYSYSEKGLGNIFIGIQTNPNQISNIKSIFTLGVYLPTASEEASINGAIADYYYLSKYIPNSLGLYFNYAFHRSNREGFKYGFEIGPNLIIPTKDNGSKTELLAHYGVMAGYQIEQLSLILEFTGIMMISEDIQPFDDRFVNMLNIGTQWDGGIVKPMIYYKYYLRKEVRQSVDGVLGLGINVSID